MRWAALAAVVLADCIVGIGIKISHDSFLVAGSTPNPIYGPTVWAEALCVLLVLAASVAIVRTKGVWLVPWVLLWVACSATAVHRFVVDHVQDSVHDCYFAIPIQSVSLDGYEGNDVSTRIGPLLKVEAPKSQKPMWVFAPVPFAQVL